MNKKELKEFKDEMKNIQEQIRQEVCASMKGMLEDIKPLFKVMNEMEDFKEKTVTHQVTFKKQVQAIQSEMENLRKALNETSASLLAINEKVAKINPIDDAAKKTPSFEKEYNASDQKKIAADAKHKQKNSDLSDLKKLEERVRTLEQKSMFEVQAQGGLGVNMPNEVQLRERKRNNLILFGLNGASQDGRSDQDLVRTLFDDLGV